jgi:hypothetical protein
MLTGVAADCVVSRALHPDRIVAPPRVSCGPGCSCWEAGPEWDAASSIPSGRAGADGQNYLWVFNGDARVGWVNSLLVRTDGVVVLALSYAGYTPGSNQLCRAAAGAAQDGYAAFGVYWGYWGMGPNVTRARSFVFYAPLNEISRVAEAVATPQDEVFGLEVGPRGVVWSFEGGASGGIIDGVSVDAGEWPVLLPNGDVVSTSSHAVARRTPGGLDTYPVDITPRSFLTDALTDGRRIAWMDYVETGNPADMPASTELHVATYDSSAATFSSHVVEPPQGLVANEFAMHDGLFAHSDTDATFGRILGYRVVDLATGVVRRVAFAPDESVAPTSSLFLVSARELVFETWHASGTHRFYFVDPMSLPIVAPPDAVADAGLDGGG